MKHALLMLLPALVACSHHQAARVNDISGSAARIELGPDLYVEPLARGVWRHVSFKEVVPWGNVLSAGLLIDAPRGLLLLDTPWTPDQASRLTAWGRERFGKEIHEVVITHAHEDRYGGAPALLSTGATLRAIPATIERLRAMRLDYPILAVGLDDQLELLGEPVELLFPGAAHAPDNIVVWLPRREILMGGCMIRAAADRSLGNLEDADPLSWRTAIRRVISRFPAPRIVVPSHGAPGGPELLLHTQRLADEAPITEVPR